LQVKEIMTKNPACCLPGAGLPEVVNLMIENDCGCIPVIENHENMNPVGMITDPDMAVRAFILGRNPIFARLRLCG